jgi:hypothetical protein
MTESATRKVWVMASLELLEQMREGWSPPVEVHATENPDGSWEMTFRVCYNEKGEVILRDS